MSGTATPCVTGFAVDMDGALYVGTYSDIRVYQNNTLARIIRSKYTSGQYRFTLDENENIVLCTGSTCYIMDKLGNVLEKKDDPGASMYNQLSRGMFKITSSNGDIYRLKGVLGRTHITKNGMQRVYQISILSVGVKYTYVLCFLSGFVFIPWIIYRFKDDAKKENMLVWPE